MIQKASPRKNKILSLKEEGGGLIHGWAFLHTKQNVKGAIALEFVFQAREPHLQSKVVQGKLRFFS